MDFIAVYDWVTVFVGRHEGEEAFDDSLVAFDEDVLNIK
jgi:hypothetical protein